jgi:MucR family transcriptional regulator, transcriptional regulator of exopolysaccharide biosynthesis
VSIKTMMCNDSSNRQEMVAAIVAAYVGRNPTAPGELPKLIKSVYDALAALDVPGDGAKTVRKPAVAPAKSVGRGYVVCLEDGLRFKSLKRHLKVAHGMAPEAYRAKWRLSKDHPIVAPAYSQRRSAIAKQFKLGQEIKARRSAKAAGRRSRKLKNAA